jgi:hypothetical protein
MTARSTTTATKEFSPLDGARRSLGCRQRPFILIAQLEQSQQDLIVGAPAVVGWPFGHSVPGSVDGGSASRLFAEPRRLGD